MANFATILGLILVYTALTSWIYVLALRWITPRFDELGRKNYFWGPLYLVVVTITGFVLYNYFPGLLIIIVPVLLVAAIFGRAQGTAMMLLFLGAFLGAFALIWYPFGYLTGIGWMGMFAYPYLCYKSFDFYDN